MWSLFGTYLGVEAGILGACLEDYLISIFSYPKLGRINSGAV